MKFILGITIGSLVTTLVFYNLPYKKYEQEEVKHDSIIIEEDKHQRLITEVPSIIIFYNPSKREHKKLHKWLKRYNIQHIHQ